jgi:hypothetical protein
MSKRKTAKIMPVLDAELAVLDAPVIETPIETPIEETKETEAPIEETEVEINDEQVEEDIRRPKSVVPAGYKRKYAYRAVSNGYTTRAAKRANGDWLARELEAECVQDGKTFDMERFLTIYNLNTGEDALVRWSNRNNGWQGRLRMSGAIVLRGIVRKTGVLITPDTTIEAPASFTAKGQ